MREERSVRNIDVRLGDRAGVVVVADVAAGAAADDGFAIRTGTVKPVYTQARDATRRTVKLVDLRTEYKRRLTGPRAAQGPHRLVDELFGYGIISVPRGARVLGVTYAAARASMQKLIDVGIVDEAPIVVGGTGYYPAAELLGMVDEPLGTLEENA